MRRLLVLLTGAVGLCVATPAAGRDALAGVPLGACVVPAEAGDTPARLFAARRLPCALDQGALAPGDYWALSDPVPADAPRDLRVRIFSLWQDRLTLYALYADGAVATIPTRSATLSRAVQLGAIIELVPPRRAAPVVRLLWRIDGSAARRGVLLAQRIATAEDSARSNLTIATVYAAFAGLVFALLVYNLALWTVLRHRFQLVYCAMVAVLAGYALTASGWLAWLWPGIDNNDRIRLNGILLGLAAALAIAFARSFFEPRVFAGRLGRVAPWATAMLAASGFVFAFGSHVDVRVADRVSAVMLLPGLGMVAAVVWSAWRRESRYLRLFAIAWTVPIVAAGARIMSALNLIPANFWVDNSTLLSLAFEALVSSIAISYRVQMLGRERDDALAGEVRARALADADPLTGLLNRRAFLDRFIGRDGAWTLHLLDIDHFKSVNDTLGHDGGDEVLRVIARTLHSIVPSGGLVSRLGGEEFALVAAAGAPLDADDLLDRLRDARMPFDLRVTASIGTCTGTIATEGDWKALYRHADRALFEAKSAGRDRARSSPPLLIAA